jgi:hypothetical protein
MSILKNIRFKGKESTAIQQENGQWTIVNEDGITVISNEEYQNSQYIVGVDMNNTFEDAYEGGDFLTETIEDWTSMMPNNTYMEVK